MTGLTAEVNDQALYSPVAVGKYFTYKLQHKSESEPTYSIPLSSVTYTEYDPPYSDPFQIITTSGDVDSHSAQHYYQLSIAVKDSNFNILSQRSFEYDDPFIYDVYPYGIVYFKNRTEESSDVCNASSITFNID